MEDANHFFLSPRIYPIILLRFRILACTTWMSPHVEKREYIAKKTSLPTWTTRTSVSVQTFKYWWSHQVSLEWARRAEQPAQPYSFLQALKMDFHTDRFLETHLPSILLLRLLLVRQPQADGWRLRLQFASRGSPVFSQWLNNGLYMKVVLL